MVLQACQKECADGLYKLKSRRHNAGLYPIKRTHVPV